MPGPVPKRDGQRRRRNTPARGAAERASGAVQVVQPPADEDWHPTARGWYESLAESGQAKFYEPSDWQEARIGASVLTTLLTSSKPSSEMFKGWLSLAERLLTTEGARRRARLELERGEEAEADVSELDDYRSRLRTS